MHGAPTTHSFASAPPIYNLCTRVLKRTLTYPHRPYDVQLSSCTSPVSKCTRCGGTIKRATPVCADVRKRFDPNIYMAGLRDLGNARTLTHRHAPVHTLGHSYSRGYGQQVRLSVGARRNLHAAELHLVTDALHHRTTTTLHHRTTAPPHHRTTAPPHHRTTAPPHHRTTAPPHHRTTEPPHQHTNTPTHQCTNAPIHSTRLMNHIFLCQRMTLSTFGNEDNRGWCVIQITHTC
jgi:hypothetical protein